MGLGKRLMMESRRGNFGACKLALRGATDAFLGRMGKRVAPAVPAEPRGAAPIAQ